MPETKVRIVGERGQVTIPKSIREKEHLHSGDKVIVSERNGDIIIKKADISEVLKEGYQNLAKQSEDISEEMLTASKEALERQ
ncbi:MAG: AbrB/MazE/SpoVT family DNA-binding domain-containing protein [Thermoplasmatota archaeon]